MSAYTIRPLQRRDVPAAQSIRRSAGWNQTDADWMRLLELNPDGCFAIDLDGVLAATATTTVYGRSTGDGRSTGHDRSMGQGGTLAWIGMVLVHPEYRRRGLATSLLERCLDHVTTDRSVECVKLDATPDGEAVYARLGFEREVTLFRWRGLMPDASAGDDANFGGAGASPGDATDATRDATGAGGNAKGAKGDATGRPIDDRDGPWSSIDWVAFGVDRMPLLRRLASGSLKTVLDGDPGRDIDSPAAARQPDAGFGMLREGAVARYLGPVVARSETTGRRIVHELLGRVETNREFCEQDASNDVPVFWDIPECNGAAERLAEELGFVRDRSLIRMWHGRQPIRGNPEMQWAIGGPETG